MAPHGRDRVRLTRVPRTVVRAGRASLRVMADRAGGRALLQAVVRELELATRPRPDWSALAAVPERAPATPSLNRVCGIDSWDDPTFLMYLQALGLDRRVHRKHWEWAMCVIGLELLGALSRDADVLGVAAGHEPVLFYLANRCRRVVATDLYAGEFAALEDHPDFLISPERYAPIPYRKDALQPMRANALALPFPDQSFEVVYSLSSVEHLGGHQAAVRAVKEMARVLKPGGVACIATELILEGGDHFEFFTPQEFRRCIIDASGLEMVEPFDARPPGRDLIDAPIDPAVDPGALPHVVLREGELRFTSAIVFMRKIGPTLKAEAVTLPAN